MSNLRPIRFKSRLINKIYITETVLQLDFSCPSEFDFKSGQFVNVNVTAPFRRPYSIISSKNESLSILVEVRDPGRGSDFFRNMRIGEETEMLGPLGRFGIQPTQIKKVFISTGVGIAPFIPMIKSAIELGSEVELFQGMRYYSEDLAIHYLSEFINSREIKYNICVTREIVKENELIQSFGERVTGTLPKLNYNWKNLEFYICGGSQMVIDTKIVLKFLGATNIFIENYG
jgi:all-trans-retinol 13,14-reductase